MARSEIFFKVPALGEIFGLYLLPGGRLGPLCAFLLLRETIIELNNNYQQYVMKKLEKFANLKLF